MNATPHWTALERVSICVIDKIVTCLNPFNDTTLDFLNKLIN